MMDFWKSLSGMVEAELFSADPESRLCEINEQGITLFSVDRKSEMKLRFRLQRKDFRQLESICQKRGDQLKICGKYGLFTYLECMLRRRSLLTGIVILVLASFILPTRVLFVAADGNVLVPSDRILEAAEKCGLKFGVSRREVRSEQIKNGLLEQIPELKWAGVNTYGCLAVISVRESQAKEVQESKTGVSNMVAGCDGIVLSVTATKGNLICKPGQIVRQGEILISGYTDCGRVIRVSEAEGEVFAQTLRSVSMVTPVRYTAKGKITAQKRFFSIRLGKKRINLWKDSGIWDASCGRMYQEYVLTLPGGFRLPVALCVDTITQYETTAVEHSEDNVSDQLRSYAQAYLLRQMNAGQIRTGSVQITPGDGVMTLDGTYVCTEMIGRIQPEQIGE